MKSIIMYFYAEGQLPIGNLQSSVTVSRTQDEDIMFLVLVGPLRAVYSYNCYILRSETLFISDLREYLCNSGC
jgi:hypothetical protein